MRSISETDRWALGLAIARLFLPCVLLVSLGAIGCSESGRKSPTGVPSLSLRGTAPAPYSLVKEVSLPDEERACVVDHYEYRVRCYYRSGRDSLSVGGKGSGPGEYRLLAQLERGPRGTFAAFDYESNRMTMYDDSGRIQKTLSIPPGFAPLRSFTDSVIVGTYATFTDSIRSAPVAWISLVADSVVMTRVYRHLSEASSRSGIGWMSNGAYAPDGELVFVVNGYTLARYDLNGSFLEEFTSPVYDPEPMTERDRLEFLEGARQLAGGAAPSEKVVEELLRRPRPPLVRGASIRFDESGRLWVPTTRDHEAYSYFDLFDPPDYLGSVQVGDRLLAFDVLGSTLVVLVERNEQEQDGVRRWALDWYDITPP